MTRYRLEIRVTPRPGLLDPEGNAIHHALDSLGYPGVEQVRVGKAIYLDLEADSEEGARETADEMCRKLLANPVTEDYQIEVLGRARGGDEAAARAGRGAAPADAPGTGAGP
ncbi:MAG TPA: phosphoribosylformylglycinamidine synthase subunit PurS [Longimicrobiales bacterium]|nr:phosphoribosylformylglycinamidine synthase subunit PurS [Longimicrobiales bacterium]